MMMITVIAVCGCGNVKKGIEETGTDLSGTVDENGNANVLDRDKAARIREETDAGSDPGHEFDDLTEEMLAAVPDIETMTQEDLFAMSIDEFRAFVAAYCPDYREYYGVREDMVMTDDDWQSLRSLMSYNMFGKMWYQSGTDAGDRQLAGEDVEDSMYEIAYPDDEVSSEDMEEMIAAIESMTDTEFRELIISVLDGDGETVSRVEEMAGEDISPFKEKVLFYLREELKLIRENEEKTTEGETETEQSETSGDGNSGSDTSVNPE